jgi:hypothetical protein
LYTLKQVAGVAFPFFIALLIFVRKWQVKLFTQDELEVLDAEVDLPPDPEPETTEGKVVTEDKVVAGKDGANEKVDNVGKDDEEKVEIYC